MAIEFEQFDVETFLRDYWQKKPLLIRNPWKSWNNPLDPDELAGLACESEVESRLIMQSQASWDLEQGPLAPDRFSKLGARPWTLLVQAVDHHVPEVAALLEPFRFIPNWRVDDVMVSYAVDLLSQNHQRKLRNIMNTPSAVFYYTTNDIHRIDGGVRNRCHEINLCAADASCWLPLFSMVLQDRGASVPSDVTLLPLIDACNGSARDIINAAHVLASKRIEAGLTQIAAKSNAPDRDAA